MENDGWVPVDNRGEKLSNKTPKQVSSSDKTACERISVLHLPHSKAEQSDEEWREIRA